MLIVINATTVDVCLPRLIALTSTSQVLASYAMTAGKNLLMTTDRQPARIR